MSGLERLLAGEEPSAVYRWQGVYAADDPADDPAGVERTVLDAGWRFAPVWGTATKEDTLEALGVALGFGEHYGRNLDALADCLRDLEGRTVVLWCDWAGLAENDPTAMTAILRVFAEASGVAVLLVGDGPDLGLAWLG